MSRPEMDYNDLARLLDRTMSEEEHGRALAQLAESDGDAEVLGDAAYLLRELEGQDAAAGEGAAHPRADGPDTVTDAGVVPLHPPSTARTRPRRLPARWLALAAVLAGVLLVPLALSRSGARAPGDYAPLLASRDAGLPVGWDKRPWGASRGRGTETVDNGLAAELGALQVDLEIAAAAGQAQNVRTLARTIVQRLEPVAGSAVVASAYADVGRRADEPAGALASALREAREGLAGFVDADAFALGAWAEAARIAVKRRDADFFRADASDRLLDRAASRASLDSEARAAVQGVRQAAGAATLDWAAIESANDRLLQELVN